MKPMLRFLSLAAVLTAAWLPLTAHGQQFITRDAGFYWWADLGATVPQNGRITEYGGLSTGQTISYDVGVGMNVSGGYAFNQYLSLEGQIGWTWNPIGSITGVSMADTSFSTMPLMANVVLHYPIPRTRLVPYAGAGVGGALTIFDTDGLHRQSGAGTLTFYGTEADFVFAWQAFAGLRLALNDKMTVGIGYRYLCVNPSSFSFDSLHYGGPTLRLGTSTLQSHLAALTFSMKF